MNRIPCMKMLLINKSIDQFLIFMSKTFYRETSPSWLRVSKFTQALPLRSFYKNCVIETALCVVVCGGIINKYKLKLKLYQGALPILFTCVLWWNSMMHCQKR